MFNLLCQAADAGAEGTSGGGLMNILFLVGIFVVFYFFMIRPQQKRQKEIQKFREGIKRGDSVVTAGGIYGVVREISEEYFVVEVTKGVSIRVAKASVYPSASDANENAQATDQNK